MEAYKNIDFMNRTNRGDTCKGYLKGYEEAVSCFEEEKKMEKIFFFFSFFCNFFVLF